MSSVIAFLDQDQAIVATDTLCTVKAGPRKPFFGSKAFLLPHMNMLVAASGSAGFPERWCNYLNQDAVYPGVETLARYAQEELQELWPAWVKEYPWPDGMEQEQAIFLFGISEFSGEILGYSFVSYEENFKPREVSYRVHQDAMAFCKPKCSMAPITEAEQVTDIPKAMLTMMEEQRANQRADAYGLGDGVVSIGGEMQIHHLTKAGCAVYKAGRFDDYNAVRDALWADLLPSFTRNV